MVGVLDDSEENLGTSIAGAIAGKDVVVVLYCFIGCINEFFSGRTWYHARDLEESRAINENSSRVPCIWPHEVC